MTDEAKSEILTRLAQAREDAVDGIGYIRGVSRVDGWVNIRVSDFDAIFGPLIAADVGS